RDERSKTDLPSQLVCSARVKATEALKSAFAIRKKKQKASCPISKRCSIRYDERSANVKLDKSTASLATVAGRKTVGLIVPPYHQSKIGWKVCSSDLCETRDGRLFLHVVVEAPAKAFEPSGKFVGLDMGVNRPAVT